MRLSDKQLKPEWKAGLNKLRAEMAKLGSRLDDRAPAQMSKGELHQERKNLRAALDDMMKRSGDDKALLELLGPALDVGIDLVKNIQDQFDLRGITESHVEDLLSRDSSRVPILRPGDSFEAVMNRSGVEDDPARRVSFGECIQAMVGLPTRHEVKNTLSEGTDSAGGFTVPAYLLGKMIDRLRAKSVAIRAGALTVPLETQKTSIARLATDPTVAWRLENAAVGGADPTFEKITFTAQSLACLIKLSREVMEDSLNIDAALQSALVNAMALEIDRVALFGSGTPPEPLGVYNLGTGLNSVSMGTNGAQITNYDNLVSSVYELELDNNDTPSAFIMHPRTSKTLRTLKDTTNQPLVPPPDIADVPRLLGTLGSLVLSLETNLSQFKSDLGAARQAAESASKAIEQSINSANDRIVGKLQAVAAAAVSIGTIVAVKSVVEDAIHATAAFDDMAQRTGIAVEQLSKMGNVAKIGGHSLGEVEVAAGRLVKGSLGGGRRNQGRWQSYRPSASRPATLPGTSVPSASSCPRSRASSTSTPIHRARPRSCRISSGNPARG
jgi:HK97 family phage major capsid protein